eukprot:scpid102760/ scgid31620/ 
MTLRRSTRQHQHIDTTSLNKHTNTRNSLPLRRSAQQHPHQHRHYFSEHTHTHTHKYMRVHDLVKFYTTISIYQHFFREHPLIHNNTQILGIAKVCTAASASARPHCCPEHTSTSSGETA